MNQDDSLEAPIIGLRNEKKEIDLAELGDENLEVLIKYTGMAENQAFDFQWFGADAQGKSFDHTAGYNVDSGEEITGKKIFIDNSRIKAVEGGEAFCSYTVENTQKSLRLFSFVGVRAVEPSDVLPVALALESHHLVIKPKELETAGVTFVVAPYQALQEDDEITFTLKGFDAAGQPEDPVVKKLKVTAEHLANEALTFKVGKNELLLIEGGRAEVFYQIDFGDGKTAKSPQQEFIIDSKQSLPDFLPKPVIVDHAPGDPLNPDNFTKGVAIWVDAYPGMAVSDRVTLCWRSPVRDFLRTIRVDASTQTVKGVAFHIPVDYLLENQGRSVSLHYLFGREGAGQQSQVLPISIENKRELSAPLISVAKPDDSQKDRGTMAASDGFGGVWVEVPNVLMPGETAQVEWRGWPGYGTYIADPEDDNPLLFHIPAQYVPANMGRSAVDESRRFNVVYWVIGEGDPIESDPYHLRIQPFPGNPYPRIVCDRVVSGELSLKDVPATGVELTLGTWYYGVEGNLIELSITGVTSSGGFNGTIRDASKPVTKSEAESGIKATLARATLEQLEKGSDFTLHVRMSFDGGAHYYAFPSQPVTLVE